MPDYASHWQTLLKEKGTEGVDLIASLTEDALNDFLAKHFTYDNVHYSKEIKKQFNDGTQLREFTLDLEVAAPLRVDFPPFANMAAFTDNSGWNDVDHREASERGALTTPNVRITCDALKFKLKWPNLTPPPKEWDWEPEPLSLVAEAYLWLDYFEGRYRLQIEPTRIKFDPARLAAALTLEKANDKCEQKFNDLLVIALNVAAYEFGPSLVRAIEIPAFNIEGLPIYPAYLNLSADILTIGAGVDQKTFERQTNERVALILARYLALLDEDMEAATKSGPLFPRDGRIRGRQLTNKQIQSILTKNLPRSRAYVAAVGRETQRAYATVREPRRIKRLKVPAAPVAEGLGVALDEYFVDTLLPRIVNKDQSGQSEADLGVVKGGVRWWLRVWNPDAEFQNNDIVGSASVDIGGAVFACVRKFWDCSWRWECGEISLGITGRPAIRLLTSNVNEGIAIRFKIDGKPSFSNNLPYPFNEIINAVGNVVIAAIVDILNLFLSTIVIVVVGVEIAIPKMKTKLKLSGFNRFMFSRDPKTPVPLPASKQKFLGVKATVEAHG